MECFDSMTGDSPSEPADTVTEAQPIVTEELFDKDLCATWKAYLDELDSTVQEQVKDPTRNTEVKKMVADETGEVLCESDDFVIAYNCVKRQVDRWSIKQEDEDEDNMLEVDVLFREMLETWQPVDLECHKETHALLKKEMAALRILIKELT